MTDIVDRSRPVMLTLGPRPEEKGLIVRPGARETYPDEVYGRLAADAAQIIGKYPQQRSALIPLLHLVQAEDSYVSPAGVEFCADQLGLTGAEVAAVATFYSMYRRSQTGDYHVGVCTNTLCAVMGGDAIFAALKDHLDVGNGETTPDGKVTLEHIECNAACDFAPVIMVNWEFFDNQTPESATTLVDALRSGEQVTPTRGAPLCSFRETARILAGFHDQRPGASEAAGSAGPATLAGLEVARERGMSAPPEDAGSATTPPTRPPESPEQKVADKPAPAPSASVPPTSSTGE